MTFGLLRNVSLYSLLVLGILVSACGNETNTLAPTTNAATTTSSNATTNAQTSAVALTPVTTETNASNSGTTSAVASLSATPVNSSPQAGVTGSSLITITIAPPPTFAPYDNPNLDFFYNYANSKPLSVTEAAKNAFTASAAQTIKTQSIKVELYTSSDDPAKIFKSFADQAQAKGYRVAKQDDRVVAVINDQTKEIGQATVLPPNDAAQILGINPAAANGGIIYAVITGKLAPNSSTSPKSPGATSAATNNSVTPSTTP